MVHYNDRPEAEELALAIMLVPGFAEADSGFAVGKTPEETLQAFRNWRTEKTTKDENISKLIRNRGLGSIGKKLDEIVAGFGQFRTSPPDETGKSRTNKPVEKAKHYPTPE